MNSIPASALVTVQPGVVGSGGNPLSLNSVWLTQNTSVPIGQVYSFPSLLAVQNFFGAGATESLLAAVYFNGFDGSNIKPGALLFSQYNTASVAAYVRGGSLSAMTLTQLQALSGTLIVTVDGVLKTSSTINLSAATSFSNAATIIQAGFTSFGATCSYNAQLSAFVITSATTGATSTIGFCTGTLSTSLLMTSATGAVTSQGAIAATQTAAMNAIANFTQNWATFMTVWEPVTADKVLFAAWSNAQNQRYLYVAWDSDVTALQSGNTTSFGPLMVAGNYNGVCPVYPAADKAAFICGASASIDFTQQNGRITFAYKGQAGLVADVTDFTSYTNLKANGYNCYAAFATANQAFTFLQPGSVPGVWKWIDAYINQIYLNSQLQLALMTLMASAKSIPYNNQGYTSIRTACADPITQALNFGSIRTGIPLSAQQANSVNTAAGLQIDQTLTNQGYYLQVLAASTQVRGLRGSPPCSLFYTDGGSVQTINLASIDVM